MKKTALTRKIDIVAEPLASVSSITAVDYLGQSQEVFLVREQPLTIYLNRVEIVTVMTMGATPTYLIAGFLLNQQLIECAEDIESIHVDWTVNAAAVYAKQSSVQRVNTDKRVVTSGCGQGTMFAAVMDDAANNAQHLPTIPPMSAQHIYVLLQQLETYNEVYKKSGGVHSCALCTTDSVLKTIEDVGRHNAVDALTGFLALEPPANSPVIMYTTGRLTSEMVIKTAQMGLPMIISRSGATSMGVEVAKAANITLIARAKGRRFMVLTGEHRVNFNTP